MRFFGDSPMSNTPKINTEHPERFEQKSTKKVDPPFDAEIAIPDDMVDFFIKVDNLAHPDDQKNFGMSQKKCRFCS